MTKLIASVAVVLMLAGAAQAVLLFEESFNGLGPLENYNSWNDNNGDMNLVAGSLSYPGVESSGNRAVGDGNGGADYQIFKTGLNAVRDNFQGPAGSTVYMTWLVRNVGPLRVE